jgi:putative cardiolipin synthase
MAPKREPHREGQQVVAALNGFNRLAEGAAGRLTSAFMPVWRLLRCAAGLLLLLAAGGCASLAPADKQESRAIVAETPLGRISAQSVAAGETGFRALPASAFSMDARLALARRAASSIDLQYYLLQNDASGRALAVALRDAALRGVRIRLLVDDLYTSGSAELLHGLSAYPNVEVRLFNPFPAGRALMATRWAFSLLDFARVNRRMHNKLFIVDGAFAIAGGRNIADEYFFHSSEANFVDFDLLIAGAAVGRLAATFDDYWNSRRVYTLQSMETAAADLAALRGGFERLTVGVEADFPDLPLELRDPLGYAPLAADLECPPLALLHGAVEVVADDPEKVSGRSESGHDPTTVTARVMTALEGARQTLTLASPYFIPGRIGIDTLRAARRRGVDIGLLTNSLAANDEPFASAAYAGYRKTLLKMGVEVYEIGPQLSVVSRRYGSRVAAVGRSHAKIVVIDHRTTFVGSMNMDFRSSRENTELGLLVDSPALAAQVEQLLADLQASDAYRLSLDKSGERIVWTLTRDGSVFDNDPGVGFATRLLLLLAPLVPQELL